MELYTDADLAAAERCKRPGGLAFFVQEFWDVIVPNPLQWNWHMQILCDEIQESDERVFKRLPKNYDSIFNVPPGTSKTLILSIFSTAWEFALMPEIKVFVGSFSDGAVSGISDKIRLLMKSPKYRKYFPETIIRGDRDNIHTFNTTKNGEFYAFTVGGTITSKHADILKVDDPLNPKQASSMAELTTANKFFDETLPTRKVDKKVTPTYLIMQRLAQNDPTGHLLKKKAEKIHHVCLPGLVSKHVKPEKYRQYYIDGLLDHIRLDREAIEELRIDLGPYGFAGQIEQTPVPDGGTIWQKWFIELDDLSFPLPEQCSAYGTDWDLAYTKDQDNSASAYFTSGKFRNQVYLFDFDWKHLEFPELIKWMKTKPATHFIEAKASGKSAKQTLTKQGIVAVEVPLKGGADKIARAKMATPMAAAGMVFIKKSMAERLYNDARQGILFFPKGEGSDLADALAQCLQRHNTGGFKYHNPVERSEDDEEEDLLGQLDY